ncbi:uncharacterized protein LOC109490397 [Ailuropoda melanoleuca]|uniref:uncharacterized protein LOC109490397 n=1 Tax=Ailuropoda melanoleuca TaxID=9646 RepID=UPI0014945CB7|nr:uncharacterized protein LOC109490397 [Ailuropoda melanoleuca]
MGQFLGWSTPWLSDNSETPGSAARFPAFCILRPEADSLHRPRRPPQVLTTKASDRKGFVLSERASVWKPWPRKGGKRLSLGAGSPPATKAGRRGCCRGSPAASASIPALPHARRLPDLQARVRSLPSCGPASGSSVRILSPLNAAPWRGLAGWGLAPPANSHGNEPSWKWVFYPRHAIILPENSRGSEPALPRELQLIYNTGLKARVHLHANFLWIRLRNSQMEKMQRELNLLPHNHHLLQQPAHPAKSSQLFLGLELQCSIRVAVFSHLRRFLIFQGGGGVIRTVTASKTLPRGAPSFQSQEEKLRLLAVAGYFNRSEVICIVK